MARHERVEPDTAPRRHELFGFLTTEPIAVVRPVHPKAMPVIVTIQDDIEAQLTADWKDARSLQRSLPDDALSILSAPTRQE